MIARAFLLFRLTFVLAALAASHAASAGGNPPGEAARKTTNSFNLLQVAPSPRGPGAAPTPGASLAAKGVASNPYNVPLLKNAGSFGASR